MKQVVVFCLFVCGSIGWVNQSFALTFGSYEYTINEGEITITGFLCDTPEAVIPAAIGAMPVTTIGAWAFYQCTSLTKVTIPDSVTSIGNEAFRNCTSLTSITISNSVTTIEGGLFSNCTSLNNIIIPDSVTTIDHAAFGGCSSLTSVIIPDSVTTIGDVTFFNCSSLSNVYFTGQPPALGYEVFDYTHSELVINYASGTSGWGSTFADIPTASFTPWGKYVPIPSQQGIHTDTGNWMGVLEITHAPWTWCDSVPCWFNIPEETANAGEGWVYPPHHDALQIVQIDGTDWGYSSALGKWLYLTAGGWVYMM